MRRCALLAFMASSLTLALCGCRARQPGRVETMLLPWIKHNITVRGARDTNPVPATSDRIEEGQKTFGAYCVVCHGRDAQNTGVPFANSMSPPVPSLASPQVQSYTDGQLKWIIENGLRPSGMPASKGILSDDDMWTIVIYLRHLPPAGSLGEPRTYSGNEYGETKDNDDRSGEQSPVPGER